MSSQILYVYEIKPQKIHFTYFYMKSKLEHEAAHTGLEYLVVGIYFIRYCNSQRGIFLLWKKVE